MIAPLIAAALAHATIPSGSTEPAVSIVARDGQVRASQIAAVPAQRDSVVATLPEGAGEVAMSETTRLGLIRHRFPGTAYRLRHKGDVLIVREAAGAVDEKSACAASRTPVAAGAYLVEDHLSSVRCQQDAVGGWLGYDAEARSFFARREIPAGTYLGRVPLHVSLSASHGLELVYRTREGAIMVEREVVALQSGRAGRAVFVRTEEGKVLSATLAGAEERR